MKNKNKQINQIDRYFNLNEITDLNIYYWQNKSLRLILERSNYKIVDLTPAPGI